MENGRGGDGDGGSEEDVSFICEICLGYMLIVL